jgi:hypothetical protein
MRHPGYHNCKSVQVHLPRLSRLQHVTTHYQFKVQDGKERWGAGTFMLSQGGLPCRTSWVLWCMNSMCCRVPDTKSTTYPHPEPSDSAAVKCQPKMTSEQCWQTYASGLHSSYTAGLLAFSASSTLCGHALQIRSCMRTSASPRVLPDLSTQ